MPELPDIVVYIDALRDRIDGAILQSVQVVNPFVLRSVEPPLESVDETTVRNVQRLGKRIAIGLDDELWLVIHLMIAGRLHWADTGKKPSRSRPLVNFVFSTGTMSLTEAGSKRRASLHVLRGADQLAAMNPGGLEVLDATRDEFAAALTSRNHTLKRSLTSPRLFSGVGNAYSDEILHRAQLSPLQHTRKLSDDEITRLFTAAQDTLREWTTKLRAAAGNRFPRKVTAFREGMAVHGRFGQPCPVCRTIVQRIRYADNETNYCPRCQTNGKVFADRSLSRLLKDDWPRTIEEWET